MRRRRLADRFGGECSPHAAEFRQKYLTDRHAAIFHAADKDPAIAHKQIVRIDFQLRSDDFAQLRFDFSSSHAHGVAHMVSWAAAGGDRVVRCHVCVGLDNVNTIRRDAQLFSDDLSHRRLRSLAHLHRATEHVGAAVGIENYDRAGNGRR